MIEAVPRASPLGVEHPSVQHTHLALSQRGGGGGGGGEETERETGRQHKESSPYTARQERRERATAHPRKRNFSHPLAALRVPGLIRTHHTFGRPPHRPIEKRDENQVEKREKKNANNSLTAGSRLGHQASASASPSSPSSTSPPRRRSPRFRYRRRGRRRPINGR